MRSLNTSLPSAYSSRPVPPEQLLQAFKTAALSVTNLYKAAVTDQNNSRATGYQDALDDLLRFMDAENLGLQDGEGWRVRQWATERYDHTANHPSSEAEENKTASPDVARDEMVEDQDMAAGDSRAADASNETGLSERDTSSRHQRHVSAPPIFRFTATSPNQANDDMQTNEEASSPPVQAEASSQPAIQVQVLNRNRAAHRNNNSRHGRTAHRTPTSAAGAKRKLQQLPDFFDISNINFKDDHDNGAGGKRSRLA